MCEPVSQIPIVGHQDETLTFVVEAAHQVQMTGLVHQLTDRARLVALLFLDC